MQSPTCVTTALLCVDFFFLPEADVRPLTSFQVQGNNCFPVVLWFRKIHGLYSKCFQKYECEDLCMQGRAWRTDGRNQSPGTPRGTTLKAWAQFQKGSSHGDHFHLTVESCR